MKGRVKRLFYKEKVGPYYSYWDLRCWVYLVGVVATVAILFGSIFFAIVSIEEHACRRAADRMHVEWSYEPFSGGCFVRIGGDWIPLDNYRGTEEIDR